MPAKATPSRTAALQCRRVQVRTGGRRATTSKMTAAKKQAPQRGAGDAKVVEKRPSYRAAGLDRCDTDQYQRRRGYALQRQSRHVARLAPHPSRGSVSPGWLDASVGSQSLFRIHIATGKSWAYGAHS